jgi:hypothetical protein
VYLPNKNTKWPINSILLTDQIKYTVFISKLSTVLKACDKKNTKHFLGFAVSEIVIIHTGS